MLLKLNSKFFAEPCAPATFCLASLVKSTLESISSTFYVRIFRTEVVSTAFFYVHVTRKKLQNKTFVQKMLEQNVDEIDTWMCVQGSTYSLVVSEFVGLRVCNLGHELLVMHGGGVDLDLQRLGGGLLGNNNSLSGRCHLRSRGWGFLGNTPWNCNNNNNYYLVDKSNKIILY